VKIRSTRPTSGTSSTSSWPRCPGSGKGTSSSTTTLLFGNAGQAVVARLPLAELIKPDAVLRRCS